LAFVAAEAREFSGLLRKAERTSKLDWPVDFARRVWLNGRAAVLVANGPGPKLAGEAVEIAKGREELTGLVSTGFCGALDPALKALDIFVATEILPSHHDCVLPNRDREGVTMGLRPTKIDEDAEWFNSWQAETPAPPCSTNVGQAFPLANSGKKERVFNGALLHTLACARGSVRGGSLLSIDRVASTVAEKHELYATTGAAAIEMEAAAVAQKAKEYNLPFYCIRVVTDTATESFPLDFNRMRDDSGRFSRTKIIAAALRRPSVFPKLIELNKRCKLAAEALGDFIADTRF
jgi:nucleoside phosphorylase